MTVLIHLWSVFPRNTIENKKHYIPDRQKDGKNQGPVLSMESKKLFYQDLSSIMEN